MRTISRGRFALPAFSENSRLRLFLGTMLYLAQGFPQGVVFYALPTWLAVNGQSAADIGTVASAVLLPWSFKFLAGGFVDRYTYLAMGRRRSWLIGAQFVIVATFVAFAAIRPDASDIAVIAGIAFVLSSATAIQDIALDALVIDLTPDEELGRLNGFMFGGKLIGIAAGTAVTAFLIEHFSIGAAMIGALLMFLIPAIAAVAIRERPGEKLLPWMPGQASAEALAIKPEAWLPLLKSAFAGLWRRDVIVVLALMMIYGFHQQVLDSSLALFAANVMEWGETRFSTLIAIANIAAAIVSLTLAGWLVDRFGPKQMALISGILGALCVLSLVAAQALWGNDSFFIAWFLAKRLAIVLFYLAMLVLAMRVTDEAAAAINFNILMGGFAFGATLGGAALGSIDALGGMTLLLTVAGIALAVSGACAICLSRALGPVAGLHGEPEATEVPVAALP